MNWWRSLKSIFRGSTPASQLDISAVESLLEYHFVNPDLLVLALTHRSALRSGNAGSVSNERLEFLGDSILGAVISHLLYDDYQEMSEGDLTKTKSLLVNEATLCFIGLETGLNKHIYLSPEEERSGGRERASIVSDTMEAIIGATFLDGGLEPARNIILRCIYSRKDEIIANLSLRNYKGELLELAQSKNGVSTPRYEVVSEEGPDHAKRFRVIVDVGGKRVGEGVGSTKKEAEQNAARKALEQGR